MLGGIIVWADFFSRCMNFSEKPDVLKIPLGAKFYFRGLTPILQRRGERKENQKKINQQTKITRMMIKKALQLFTFYNLCVLCAFAVRN